MVNFGNVIKSIGSFLNPAKRISEKTGAKIVSGVVPFGPGRAVSVAKGAGGIAKKVFDSLKTFTTKKTINPAAGVSGVKNIANTLAKAVGVGATVGTIFQAGRLISKAGVSGEPPSIKTVAKALTKGAATGAGLGLSPVGGAIGSIEGGATFAGKSIKQRVLDIFGQGQSRIEDATNKFSDAVNKLPTMPSYNIYNQLPSSFTPQDVMPQLPQAVYIESPQIPQIQSPGFSPSISLGGMGGGLGENLPLLLLLGAGIGGYALGRRKRKKKKYKKRKRH